MRGSALALVASNGGAARDGWVLAVFGFGAALPLVAVAYASRAGFVRGRNWVLARIEPMRLGLELVLGAMGIAILTGADKRLEALILFWLLMRGSISRWASERRVSTSVNL
jgi:hypothetical protein